MYVLTVNETVTQYPYSQETLRADNPNISFPLIIPDERLADWGVFPVTLIPQPIYDTLVQKCVEDVPMLINGIWTQSWKVEAATVQEIEERKQQIKLEITNAVQQRLDTFAQTRQYDNILSACTYIGSPIEKFDIEGTYALSARSETWAKLYEILAEVETGTRPMPYSYADIEGELPTLTWPN